MKYWKECNENLRTVKKKDEKEERQQGKVVDGKGNEWFRMKINGEKGKRQQERLFYCHRGEFLKLMLLSCASGRFGKQTKKLNDDKRFEEQTMFMRSFTLEAIKMFEN